MAPCAADSVHHRLRSVQCTPKEEGPKRSTRGYFFSRLLVLLPAAILAPLGAVIRDALLFISRCPILLLSYDIETVSSNCWVRLVAVYVSRLFLTS